MEEGEGGSPLAGGQLLVDDAHRVRPASGGGKQVLLGPRINFGRADLLRGFLGRFSFRRLGVALKFAHC